ncbi:MAG: hypothetical protein M1813_008587 [Trichoglossum hirsutum]|nr:MAG: hypothetical protein M1813_008587 [Trichoglossum hirsutum]
MATVVIFIPPDSIVRVVIAVPAALVVGASGKSLVTLLYLVDVVVALVELLRITINVATVTDTGLARTQVTISTSGNRIWQGPHVPNGVVRLAPWRPVALNGERREEPLMTVGDASVKLRGVIEVVIGRPVGLNGKWGEKLSKGTAWESSDEVGAAVAKDLGGGEVVMVLEELVTMPRQLGLSVILLEGERGFVGRDNSRFVSAADTVCVVNRTATAHSAKEIPGSNNIMVLNFKKSKSQGKWKERTERIPLRFGPLNERMSEQANE